MNPNDDTVTDDHEQNAETQHNYADNNDDGDGDAGDANNEPEEENYSHLKSPADADEYKQDSFSPHEAAQELTPLNLTSKSLQSLASASTDNQSILKSTLKKKQRAWVDPWEAAVKDTFYHKQIDSLRPTFDVLHDRINGVQPLNQLFTANRDGIDEDEDEDADSPKDMELEQEEKTQQAPEKAKKFGMWIGVVARNLLNIFGVIMFLRIGFMVGQAAIIQGLLIILISTAVTVLTALSMSAICTNGTILGGGAYYMISRALGPSIGGAIGILFSVGNMCACSLYLIGFAETLVANLENAAGFSIIDGGVWDVRIWSNIGLMFVLFISIVGLSCVIKTQMGLLVFIFCAILLFFVGSFYQEYTNDAYPCHLEYGDACGDTEFISKVVITPKGWINGNFVENLGGAYDGYNFWTVLGIFFPAVTGIMAGANISGELQNPGVDIPNGTIISIIISTIVYMLLTIFVGAVTVRYELLTNDLVMAYICVWEYIVIIGIYAATLSSAIASLVGAPRILQAVASDGLFPFKVITYFGQLNKKGEPMRGYFLTTLIALCCNLIGELNAVAPLISQFFMLTYLLVNVACFGLAVSKSPGWRPSFRYFNRYTALFGSLLCLVIMFLLNWAYALAALIIAAMLFFYVYFKDPDINWGAAPQARRYYDVYRALLKLRKTKQHIKTWRPAFLILTRDPIKKPQLLLFTQTLVKAHGPLFYCTVHTGDYRTNIRKFREAKHNGYLPPNCPKNAQGFYKCIISDSLRNGIQSLIQTIGTGSLSPNTVVLGFKARWQTDSDEVLNEYVQILRDTLVMGMGLMVVSGFKRVNWFLDEYAPPAIEHEMEGGDDDDEEYDGREAEMEITAFSESSPNPNPDRISNVSPAMKMPSSARQNEDAIFISKALAAGQSKQTVVDVWWMIDDGGLCMLIPYIMKKHKFWSQCKLRMLMVAEEDSINSDIGGMKDMIKNFRLPYEGPLFVPAKKEPSPQTVAKYEALAKRKLSEIPRRSIVKKWLILTELLWEYSRFAGINVVTLPIPTKQMEPRAYLALLEMLTERKKLPPTIIMRGNGESTLTFYSD